MSASSRFSSRLARLAPTLPLAARVDAQPELTSPPEPTMFEAPLFAPRSSRSEVTSRSEVASRSDTTSPARPDVLPCVRHEGVVLEDLRARMEAILTRTRAEPKPPPPRVDIADLPFCVEDTLDGPLHS